MGETAKLLTIVVPAYNAQKYVRQCLDSLVNQTLNNHKVIIVDDGSTDEHTSEICKSYAENYPDMISYMWQENQMQGAARNHAIPLVQTEYLGFLDSDDWLPPTYIETITKEIQKFHKENIDLIFTLPTIYDDRSSNYVPWYDTSLLGEIFSSGNRIVSAIEDPRLYYLEPNACMRIYRMDFLKVCDYKIFPEGIKWEDLFPHFYLLYHAKKCLGILNTGFVYRTNTSGQTTAQSGKTRLDIVKAFKEIFDFLETQHCDAQITKAVIRKLNIFAKWSLDVSTPKIRKQLVSELFQLYNSIPDVYYKIYFSERKHYKKERLFVWCIKNKYAKKALENYLPTEIFLSVLNRIRRFRWIR